MRGRGERSRVEQLQDELTIARLFARRLWDALRGRTALEAEALFEGSTEGMRIADPVFDACEIVWEKHRVMIVPCRTILDPGGASSLFHGWPTQDELYLGRWPDGSTRNLTRDQVLMMGGYDPATAPVETPRQEVPF